MAMGAPSLMRMARRPMPTDPPAACAASILTLAQWLSPAFPIGAFSYSHGLETAIATGAVGSAQELAQWLKSVLAHGSGRNDAILLRAAFDAPDRAALERVDQVALAFAASAERRLESRLQGAAFGQTVAAVWGRQPAEAAFEAEWLLELCLPVAVGAAAARQRLDLEMCVVLYVQAFASNLVSVAMRALPLGQTEGQAVLAGLAPLCAEIAQQSRGAGLEDLHSSAFLSDIAAMHHETLQPRIFRT